MPYMKSRSVDTPVAPVEVPRRKRGRPRKHPLPPSSEELMQPTRGRLPNRTPTRSTLKSASSESQLIQMGKSAGTKHISTRSQDSGEVVEPPTKIPKKRGRKPKSYYEELARQTQQLAQDEVAKFQDLIEEAEPPRPSPDVPSSSSLKSNTLGTGTSKLPSLLSPRTPPSSVRRSARHRQPDAICDPTIVYPISAAPLVLAEAFKDSCTSSLQFSFQTCLNHVELNNLSHEMRTWHSFDGSGGSLQEPSPRSLPVVVLKRALSIQELGDESWLSSSFMDLVITQFAKTYPSARYFSVDFARLHANDTNKDEVTDILGRSWRTNFDLNSPESSLIFFVNAQNIHWTLIRVLLVPQPELQFFEPMGMPSRSRHVGLNYRTVPKSIIDWLDKSVPLPNDVSWLNIGTSVVTKAHQVTSYDCGVACLLYAEKCGQGQSKEKINLETTQQDITEYRKVLQDFMSKLDS